MASTAHHFSTSFTADENVSAPSQASKARRNSHRNRRPSSTMLLSPASEDESFDGSSKRRLRGLLNEEEHDSEITISSSGKKVTPFLTEHIPQTYNPMSTQPSPFMGTPMDSTPESNTKYCNRHRPDRKCRRQADGPSMEQLQTVG
jgi:hypothetical protein